MRRACQHHSTTGRQPATLQWKLQPACCLSATDGRKEWERFKCPELPALLWSWRFGSWQSMIVCMQEAKLGTKLPSLNVGA